MSCIHTTSEVSPAFAATTPVPFVVQDLAIINEKVHVLGEDGRLHNFTNGGWKPVPFIRKIRRILSHGGRVIILPVTSTNAYVGSFENYKRVELPEKIKDIAMSSENYFFVSEKKKLYAYGSIRYSGNYCGPKGRQDPLASYVSMKKPEPIFMLQQEDIESIAAGYLYVAVSTKSKKVFVWGDNRLGSLGLQSLTGQHWLPSELKLPVKPKKSIKLFGMQYCCFAIIDGHQLVSWGSFDNGVRMDTPKSAGFLPSVVPCFSNMVDDPLVALVRGYRGGIGVTASGLLYCWGMRKFTGEGCKIDAARSVGSLSTCTMFQGQKILIAGDDQVYIVSRAYKGWHSTMRQVNGFFDCAIQFS